MLDGHLGFDLSADKLPSLSNVALEILRLTRDPDASVKDLAEVIKTDPALTVKLLTAVNSPLFNLNREISSVNDAVNLLGMRSVRVLALSFSLVETAKGKGDDSFDFEAYWRRSLSSAVAARLIGRATAPRKAEEAFVAGLLSYLGMVAAWRCAPDRWNSVMEEWKQGRRSLHAIELDHLGATHGQISGHLMQDWGLPESLCDAVAAHRAESGDDLLVTVVQAATMISALFCKEAPSAELEDTKSRVRELTGIDEEDLEGILHALDDHVHDAATMLSVNVGETVDYVQLQADATRQLAMLSMQAEADRAASQRKQEEAQEEARRLNDEKRDILKVASTDSLTQLNNRAAFDERLAEELEHARSEDLELGLIMMDVDHFKNFNDTYGHQAGDEVLRTVGSIMKQVVQGLGFAARYGGEEFTVVTHGKGKDEVRDLAEALRRRMEEETVRYQGQDLKVTISLGAACLRPAAGEVSPESIIEEADKSLYRAKDGGRNRVEVA